jgi:hypothetical protein
MPAVGGRWGITSDLIEMWAAHVEQDAISESWLRTPITTSELIVTDRPRQPPRRTSHTEHVTGMDGWGRALFNAGYQRISDWQPTPSGFRCRVEPRSAPIVSN